MAGLFYVGKAPAVTRDVETRKGVDTALQGGVSRTSVITELGTPATVLNPNGTTDGVGSAGAKATKLLVDNQDGNYADPTYFATKDALLIPNSSRGQPNGVATLNSSGKVPAAQLPAMGTGMIKGPYGINKQYSITTDAIPRKIGEWLYPASTGTSFGVVPYTHQLMVFANVSAQSVGGRTVIEVRAGNSTQTTYAAQTRVAVGYGRSYYDDYQQIVVLPAIDDTSIASWATNTNMVVNVWMYDADGGSSTTGAGFISACLYIARTAL